MHKEWKVSHERMDYAQKFGGLEEWVNVDLSKNCQSIILTERVIGCLQLNKESYFASTIF